MPNLFDAYPLRTHGYRRLLPIVVLAMGMAFPLTPGAIMPALAQTELSVRERVEDIQRMLADRGFNPGPIDGVLGQSTISAIRDYQTSVGLPVTGMATPELRRQLSGVDQIPQSAPSETATSKASEAVSENSQAQAKEAMQDFNSAPDEVAPVSRLESSDARPSSSDGSAPGSDQDDTTLDASMDARIKAEEGNVEEGASETGKLIGTSWNFIDEGGATFTGRFGEGGSFQGPGDSRFWSWQPVAGGILITFDNRLGTSVKREGRFVEDDWLNGSAVASTGKSWNWVAERETTKEEATPTVWPPARR